MASSMAYPDALVEELTYCHEWGERSLEWKRLTRLFPLTGNNATDDTYHDPMQALDELHHSVTFRPCCLDGAKDGSPIHRLFTTANSIAICVMDNLHFGSIFRK
jgi:hypothetical protein